MNRWSIECKSTLNNGNTLKPRFKIPAVNTAAASTKPHFDTGRYRLVFNLYYTKLNHKHREGSPEIICRVFSTTVFGQRTPVELAIW